MILLKQLRIAIISLAIVLLISCDQQDYTEESLCVDFIEMNSTKDFAFLKNVSTDKRVNTIHNRETNKFTIDFIGVIVSEEFSSNTFFVLSHDQKTDSSIISENFAKLGPIGEEYFSKKANLDKNSDVFEKYCEFVDSFNLVYGNISLPSYYEFENVSVSGIPRIGGFISFELPKNSFVYYLYDSTSLSEYWVKEFERMNQYNENWYYLIEKEEQNDTN
ncbi:MAG: hypothetical protein ABFS32_12630 [Bacteroidota bacterium]